MKVFTFYFFRFSMLVCLILGNTKNFYAHKNHNFPVNAIDCSPFQLPEYYNCSSDFPEILPEFRDFTTIGNGDLQAYESIGGITNNCQNIIITVQDFNFPPNGCGDSLRVQRIYRFSDGFTTIAECSRTFVTFNLPISIVSHAENKIVSCVENVDSIFTDWLDNFGDTELFECNNISNVAQLPEIPVIFYDNCREVNAITNITGDIRVQWNFEDDCGNTVSTIASFLVIDTIAPTLLCPSDMTFDIGSTSLQSNIQNVLNQVDAIEECDDFKIINDFSNDKIQFNCDQEQMIPVIFTAIDSCQNSSECISNVIIINNSDPQITCPPTIDIECNAIDNINLILTWIASAEGLDNIGNELAIETNFDMSILNISSCIEETDITFNVTDICGRTASCISSILITDRLAPEVSCPPNFVSSFSMPSLNEDLDAYFDLFTSNDICNSFQPILNLSDTNLDFTCEDKDILVTYTVTDECGNNASCESNISIINDYQSEITCLDTLTLYCGESDNLEQLEAWLNSAEGSDNLGSDIPIVNDIDLNVDTLLLCHDFIQVNFTMTDLCGEEKSCSQVFEVLDTISPIINCPVDFTIQSSPATLEQEIENWLGSYSASDNCTITTVTDNYDNSLFEGCDLSISNDITFTVNDNCGFINSCISNLTIETDRFPTVICPPQLNIECGDIDNQEDITNWLDSSTGEDFTGIDLSVDNNYNPVNLNLVQCNGFLEVVFSVIDMCNFTDTCRTTIILEDTTPPEITCPRVINVNTSSPIINETIDDWLFSIESNDLCMTSSTSHDFDINNIDICNPPNEVLVLFTAEDECGLTATCQSTISFNVSDPIINCPPQIDLECGDTNNNALITDWLNEATAFDNSNSIINISHDFDLSIIDTSCSESYIITFSTEDNCLKTNNCTSTISIEDNTAPEIDCPNDLNLLSGDPNKESKFEDYINNISISDCNAYTISHDLDLSLLGFSCDNQLTLPFTFVATDDCGQSTSCPLTVIISNNQVLNLLCPPNLNLNCGASINQDTIAQWLQETIAEDNVGNTFPVDNNFEVNNPLLINCQSTISVTFEMVDLCNSGITCISNINIEDTEVPIINCPTDTFFIFEDPNFNTNVEAWINSANGSDNCTLINIDDNYDSSNVLGNCQEEDIQTIIFTAQDECGLTNVCTSNLTIRTSRTPEISCPPELPVQCGDIDNQTIIANWLTTSSGVDFTGNDLPTNNDYNSSNFDLIQCNGLLEVSFFVVDICNFTDTCKTTILLEDTTPPEIICPANITVNTSSSIVNETIDNWLLSVQSNDICLTSSTSHDFDINSINICSPPNEVLVSFTAEDECGLNSSCQSTISFNTTDPIINCPPQLDLECGDTNNNTLIENWLNEATAFDNSSAIINVDHDFDMSIIDTSCSENYIITFSTEDSCLNTNNCTSTISIEDTTAPEIDCPIDLNLLSGDPNKESKFEDYINNIDISDCNTYTISDDFDLSLLGFSCDDQLLLPFTFAATDNCGQSRSCQLAVIVSNNVVPNLICPPSLNLNCGDSINQDTIAQWLQETIAEDNTGNTFPVDNNFETTNPLLINCQSTIPVLFEMIDLCSSGVTCISNINIEDTGVPTVNCPIDTFFIFEDSDFNLNVEAWINSANGSDNCTTIDIDNSFDPNNILGNCQEEDIQTIIFTAQDECGLTNDCTSNLTIRTSRTPTILCPPELIVECGEDNMSEITSWLDLSSGFDSDGNDLLVLNNFLQSNLETLTCGDTLEVSFNISDDCNFMAECNSILLVEDNTPPSVICEASLNINSSDTEFNITIDNWLDSFSGSDNCSMITSTNDFDLIGFDICDTTTEYQITFVATDNCGLSNSCQSSINISKDQPEIICPPNLVLECGLSDVEIDLEVQMLIAQIEAFDNAGNTLTDLSDDYISSSLVNACQSSVDITAIAIDNCSLTNECTVNVSIVDTTSPILVCPSELTINLEDSNNQNRINIWLESYNVDEACNFASTTNDYTFDISSLDCGTFIDVEFFSEDECGNNTSCFSSITFINNNTIEITCPNDITVSCSTFNSSLLNDFFDEVSIESQDTFTVTNDYVPLALSCTDIEIQSITFEAIDICNKTNACTSTITYTPDAKTYIPNTFSPNGDGDNDFFTVFSNEFVLSINSMAIYDRWGELIFIKENFAPNDESQGWDGRFKSEDAVQGVYVYVITYENDRGSIIEEVGQLNLLR